MGRQHEHSMTSRASTTVNKAYLEKVTKNSKYQASEKKARRLEDAEKHFLHDQSIRKKE